MCHIYGYRWHPCLQQWRLSQESRRRDQSRWFWEDCVGEYESRLRAFHVHS